MLVNCFESKQSILWIKTFDQQNLERIQFWSWIKTADAMLWNEVFSLLFLFTYNFEFWNFSILFWKRKVFNFLLGMKRGVHRYRNLGCKVPNSSWSFSILVNCSKSTRYKSTDDIYIWQKKENIKNRILMSIN